MADCGIYGKPIGEHESWLVWHTGGDGCDATHSAQCPRPDPGGHRRPARMACDAPGPSRGTMKESAPQDVGAASS